MGENPYIKTGKPAEMIQSYVCYADILGYSRISAEAIKSGNGNSYLLKLRNALSEAYSDIKKDSNRQDNDDFYAIKIFTDNIVVGCPVISSKYYDDDGEVQLGQMLLTFGNFQTGLASLGYFLRGGIAYGDHYMDKDIVFGPAFLEAVKLDKGGGPPRISLSPSAINAVKIHMNYYGKPINSPQNELLLRDTDGEIFLNYLCIAFDNFPWDPIRFDLIENHKRSIIYGLDIYKGEPDIRAKYEWVARYHNYICRDFAKRNSPPADLDVDEEFVSAMIEAQKLLNYLIDIESMAPEPHRIAKGL